MFTWSSRLGLLVTAAVSAWSSVGRAEEPVKAPKTITIMPPPPRRGLVPIWTGTSSVAANAVMQYKEDRRTPLGTMAMISYSYIRELPGRSVGPPLAHSAWYQMPPGLRPGDIVPAIGYVYRVLENNGRTVL